MCIRIIASPLRYYGYQRRRLDIPGLSSTGSTSTLRDRIQQSLEEHCRQKLNQVPSSTVVRSNFLVQSGRFGRLLLALPSLQRIGSATIQRVFFSSLGDASVESILKEIFQAEGAVLHLKQEA